MNVAAHAWVMSTKQIGLGVVLLSALERSALFYVL
jgi:hypothetical protein